MGKNKTLLLLIGVLLIANFVMLYLLLKPEVKPSELTRVERMVKMLQDELGLDSMQTEAYLLLREYRDKQLKPLQDSMKTAKTEMVVLLRKDGLTDIVVNEAARKVGDEQALIEIAYFEHFKRMQQLLTPEQQPKFDSLLFRMVNRSNTDDNQRNRDSNRKPKE
jgi:Spy/CpxP family protein refolding chaperone